MNNSQVLELLESLGVQLSKEQIDIMGERIETKGITVEGPRRY